MGMFGARKVGKSSRSNKCQAMWKQPSLKIQLLGRKLIKRRESQNQLLTRQGRTGGGKARGRKGDREEHLKKNEESCYLKFLKCHLFPHISLDGISPCQFIFYYFKFHFEIIILIANHYIYNKINGLNIFFNFPIIF